MFIVNYRDYAERFDCDKRVQFNTKEELDAFMDRINKYFFDVDIISVCEIKSK